MDMKTGVAPILIPLALFLAGDIQAAGEVTPRALASGAQEAPPTQAGEPATMPVAGYKLAWADDFDGAALDMTKWDYDRLGAKKEGVVVNAKDAVTVADGLLTITTYTADGKHFTGAVATRGKFERTFGYYEARIKFQNSPGVSSAFWITTPHKGNPTDNPNAGTEMDVCEHRVTDKSGRDLANRVTQYVNWGGSQKDKLSKMQLTGDLGLAGGFHVYGLEWTEKGYRFFVDGKLTWDPITPVSKRPEYIILSSGVIGLEGKAGGIPAGGYGSRKASATKMVVDYVRFYERPDNSAIKVIFKTVEKAPPGFGAWTFFWTAPSKDADAKLEYVVMQPDGKEYYRRDVSHVTAGTTLNLNPA